jgi:hypothetical protein
MGQLYIPGKKEIKGPWLISSNELEELDEILELIDIKIIESTEIEIKETARLAIEKGNYKDLETAISKIKEYRFTPNEKVKKVTLISSDEKRLIDSSIAGILKDPKVKDFKPKELSINIEYRYSNQFNLNIERRFDGDIRYDVRCFDQSCEEEIKYKVETWLEKYQPSKPRQVWSEFSFIFLILSFLIITFSALFMVRKEFPDFKSIYKNEITQIIDSGVSKDNETKSIELLLKYTADYKPDNIKEVTKINPLAVKLFSISVFILLISLFKPKTTIGIGKHKSLVKIYKFYTTAVLITLPSIFIIAPLFEWLKGLLSL